MVLLPSFIKIRTAQTAAPCVNDRIMSDPRAAREGTCCGENGKQLRAFRAEDAVDWCDQDGNIAIAAFDDAAVEEPQ
jgi:hypothetical protein